MRVIIVGGGVIGCAIAYELASQSADVTLIERDSISAHASRVAAGMLMPLTEASTPGPFVDLGLQSLRQFNELAPRLKAESGMDIELQTSGSLRVALSDEDVRELHETMRWQSQYGLRLEWLDRSAAYKHEPILGPQIRGALYCPDEQHVHSHRLTIALCQAAGRHGAKVLEGTPITGLHEVGGKVAGVRTPAGILESDYVVLATGAWTGLLQEWVGLSIPISPKRGQIIHLQANPQSLHSIVLAQHRYLVPRADGTIVLGATAEDAGFQSWATPEGIMNLCSILPVVTPSLAQVTWQAVEVGLRPWSEDLQPILGHVQGKEGLVMASGHGRNGILLSLVTGKLIADLLVAQHDAIPETCQARRLTRNM